MATLALPAELPKVHIVTYVTGATIRRQLHFRCRSFVASGAVQLGVRTRQCKTCRFVVVEGPDIPAIAVVTTRAVFAKAALVNIVGLMATMAIGLHILELLREMTLLAGHRHMQAHKGEVAQVVIEADFTTPGIGDVALIALVTEFAAMRILRAMTTNTCGA